jgi:hypothetical protein
MATTAHNELNSTRGLINYIDTKVKCHPKKLTCKGTFRQVFTSRIFLSTTVPIPPNIKINNVYLVPKVIYPERFYGIKIIKKSKR